LTPDAYILRSSGAAREIELKKRVGVCGSLGLVKHNAERWRESSVGLGYFISPKK
jgi:hypothetical protein